MGGGGRNTTTHTTKENPYNDAWIYDRFEGGNQRFNALEDFMRERQSALAQPKFYDVGGGMSVRQDQLGSYLSGQLERQQDQFNQRLADMQAQSQAARQQMGSVYDARLGDITQQAGVNKALIQSQGEAMARQGERARIAEAYGDQSLPGVTGVQSGKRTNMGTYGTTGSGFNRSGLRIQNLNI